MPPLSNRRAETSASSMPSVSMETTLVLSSFIPAPMSFMPLIPYKPSISSLVLIPSFSLRDDKLLRIKERECSSPTIPGMFSVPGLSLSGRISGTSWRSLWLPVPPATRGSRDNATSFLMIAPPMPWGPRRPLCPVNATAEAFSPSISILKKGAAWAASMKKSRLCFLANSPGISRF